MDIKNDTIGDLRDVLYWKVSQKIKDTEDKPEQILDMLKDEVSDSINLKLLSQEIFTQEKVIDPEMIKEIKVGWWG